MTMSEQMGRAELGADKSQRAYDLHVARVAWIATSVVVATGIGLALLWRLRVVVLLIFVSLFLGALLHPVVSFVERRGIRRGLAAALVFFIAAAVSAAVLYLLVHPVYTSATNFAKELPTLVRQAQHGKGQIGHLVTRLHLENYVKKNVPRLETLITGLGRPALAIGKTGRERGRRSRHRRGADLFHPPRDAAHGPRRAQLDAPRAVGSGRARSSAT